ncbi:unnamed protein product [Macrosiphum euphorbiae]|uniref:Uncharacterized protein n=1 Tax=Macrosiphum euphorbiae TaxID=13131 RepID=A0AAV0XPJ9_9HEMI|nr:unnamed protein product [Macrosiphum euphorbiae]
MRSRGCQLAAAVPENHEMVRHPNMCEQPGGNLGLTEDHRVLRNSDNIKVPIQIQQIMKTEMSALICQKTKVFFRLFL